MIKFNNILIIGLGMMGGSLCKSIKKHKLAEKISAFDIDQDALTYALKNKFINYQVNDLGKMKHPDLIIICTPLSSYISIVKKLLLTVKKSTLVTDIGSSKGGVHRTITKLFHNSNKTFLSSHPMVGSEKSGVKFHRNDMYKNKVVFILDKDSVSRRSYIKLKNFWECIGSVTHEIDSKTHDLLMSQTSHIAHLMSYIFVKSLPQSILNENLSLLLGGGIKEHIRLSKSNPQMWTDIFLNNKSNIIKTLSRIQKNTEIIKGLIQTSNKTEIKSLLKSTCSKTK
ncbi:MAG: prephenate dehydrogenase/arogenate dehydrogenase family protein [Pseudomonadota bacterium]|nr:prephenate dehydrogenase/arogenate dehydrogenase family protein [Pseudomonadota bacterium]